MEHNNKCMDCKYNGYEIDEYPCSECIHNYTDKYEGNTVADRLRKMNDEELAIFFVENRKCSEFEDFESCLKCFQSAANKWNGWKLSNKQGLIRQISELRQI